MRNIALAVALSALALAASAQSVADFDRWIDESKQAVASGAMTQLELHKEAHRRMAALPIQQYPAKAQNMRWIGKRIDILEALEAGQITPEQAERRLAQEDADLQAANQAAQESRRQAAAQDDAARRALAAQILMNRPAPPAYQPYLLQAPTVRPQTNCTSYRVGNTVQTDCR